MLQSVIRFVAVSCVAFSLIAFASIPWTWKATPRLGAWRCFANCSKGCIFAYAVDVGGAGEAWPLVTTPGPDGTIVDSLREEMRFEQTIREHAELRSQRQTALPVELSERESEIHGDYETRLQTRRSSAVSVRNGALLDLEDAVERGGFHGVRARGFSSFGHRAWVVRSPLWIARTAGMITALGVAMLGRLLRRIQRPPSGFCRRCGYDLTLNESGTCPECGKAIESFSPSSLPPTTASGNAEQT